MINDMGELAALADPETFARILIQIILLAASAFFSGSETALFALSRWDLHKLRRERDPNAQTIHALLDQPRRLIISIICGNTIVNIAATANLTGILIVFYGVDRAAWISTFIMLPLLLLFGEATPKTIAISNPVPISSRFVVRPLAVWVRLAAPLTALVRRVADRITVWIVGPEKLPEHILQVDEFRMLVEEGVIRGEFSAIQRDLIYNLLQAGTAEIVEIMTPRTQMSFIDGDLPVEDVIARFIAFRHERVPVYRVSRDNIIGFLHAEDVLQLILDQADLSALKLDEFLHASVMVPPTKKIDEMFDYFQSRDVSAAAVLNEFGGVDGFITMDDVLAYIFGKPEVGLPSAQVSYDEATGLYEVPGDMKLVFFNNLTNFGLDDPRMTTVGGLALRKLDRLPKVGDAISFDDITLTVIEMQAHRIARLSACRRGPNVEERENCDGAASTAQAMANREGEQNDAGQGKPPGGGAQ